VDDVPGRTHIRRPPPPGATTPPLLACGGGTCAARDRARLWGACGAGLSWPRRQAQPAAATPLPSDSLAGAAKRLSLMESAPLPAADGTAVLAEVVRHGYRSHEMLEVGRLGKRAGRVWYSWAVSFWLAQFVLEISQLLHEARVRIDDRPRSLCFCQGVSQTQIVAEHHVADQHSCRARNAFHAVKEVK